MGRAMMQPGHPVFHQIVRSFGKKVLAADGTLDRKELARLAFDTTEPRVEELNALVHPAVIAEQVRLLTELAEKNPHAIAVVESALIFTTTFAGEEPWRARFDTIVCVTAPEETKIARFVERVRGDQVWDEAQIEAARQDARQRLEAQRPAAVFQKHCLVVANDGSCDDLQLRVDAVWRLLTRLETALSGGAVL
jgi:dephospho-CoA kinase